MTIAADLDRRMSSNFRPPSAPRDIFTFAKTMRLPDGPSAGEFWIPTTEPTQAAFLRCVLSGRWRKFVIVAPSQRGKTLKAVLCPALHTIVENRQSIGYVMPNLDKLSQNWDGKIKPAIEGSGFGAWLPTKGPGSKGGKPAVLTMRDPATGLVAGRIYFMATGTGGRETSVSSVSPQTLVYDEGDDAESIGHIELVYRRIESYGVDGRAYIVSTVNDRRGRDDHPILKAHEMGTMHRIWHQCPHCSAYGLPNYENLNLESLQIFCPACSALWSEKDRNLALRNGVWCAAGQVPCDGIATGPLPDTDVYSELTTGLDYHMAVISDICKAVKAAKSAEARGDYSLMRTLMHKTFCRPYDDPVAAIEITNTGLASVSAKSDYDKRIVPNWVTHMSGAVDVQGNRLYWIVLGHGPDDRWCVIDYGYEMLVPDGVDRKETPADRRRALHELDAKFNTGWQKEGTEDRLSPMPGLRGVDVGYETAELINWLRGMPAWRACRGVGRDTLKNLGEIVSLPAEARAFVEVRKPDGWPIALVNIQAENVRRWIHAGLLRDPYTPGSGMLPRGLRGNDILCLHLSGEVHTTDKDGKPWLRVVRERHDLLDAAIYAHGLSRLRSGIQTVQATRARRQVGTVSNYLRNL